MTLKKVMRYDPTTKWLRLFRLLWTHGKVGDGEGYSNKLSFALCPKLLGWRRDWNEWQFFILGLRVHYKRSYGGVMV